MYISVAQPAKALVKRPLDLVPGAYIAVSIGRRLRGAYTGPLVRIRSTADSSETDISQLPNGTLNVAEETAHAIESTLVTMYDQSGNGNDMIMSVAMDQPTIYDGEQLRTTVGKFKGADVGAGTRVKFEDIGKTQPTTVFVVFQPNTHVANNVVSDGADLAGPGFQMGFYQVASLKYRYAAPTASATSTDSLATSTEHYAVIVYDGANSTLQMDGGTLEMDSIGTDNPDGFTFGGSSGGSTGINGKIVEAIVYDSVLSAGDQALIVDNIRAYYLGLP